mgnify:FL=1
MKQWKQQTDPRKKQTPLEALKACKTLRAFFASEHDVDDR